jgi:hypothetical protein
MSKTMSSFTPAASSEIAIALPAPPAPINRTRAPSGCAPRSICALTNDAPSWLSPCHDRSGLRRITLTTFRSREVSDSVEQQACTSNLCGMVTSTPSTFPMRDRPLITGSRSPAATCIGTQTAFLPLAAKLALKSSGDRA